MVALRDMMQDCNDAVRAMKRGALNACFPPRCGGCGVEVEAAHTLCHTCWSGLRFITDPQCAKCGVPFEHAIGADAVCGGCVESPPAYDSARAALVYDDHSQKLITRLKYGDRSDLLPLYDGWLINAAYAQGDMADYIIPVPLHIRRMLIRSYNQSSQMGRILAENFALPMLHDGLLRTRHTSPQARLSKAKRERNVKGAFVINPAHHSALQGAHVLLIDDVMTTGATVQACAKALKRGGAARVDVITLARTVL